MNDENQLDTSVSKKDMVANIKTMLICFAAVIPLCMGLLYYAGRAFYTSYLSYYGIPDALFPPPLNDTLFQGAISFNMAIVIVPCFAILMIIAAAIIYFGHIFLTPWLRPFFIELNNIGKRKKSRSVSPQVKEILNSLWRILCICYFIFWVLMLCAVTEVLASAFGEKCAQDAMKKENTAFADLKAGRSIKTNSLYLAKSVNIFGQKEENLGFIIEANDNRIALWREKGIKIYEKNVDWPELEQYYLKDKK